MGAPRVILEKMNGVAAIARVRCARDRAERAVVVVDGRHQRIRAHTGRKVEFDPLEQVARVHRVDPRHQLNRAELQRDTRKGRRVREELRALPAVGRDLLAGGAAVLFRSRIRPQVGGVEHLEAPGSVHL